MTQLIFRVEDKPYRSVHGLDCLVSFNVYKDEIFDVFGSWEYDHLSFGEVEIRMLLDGHYEETAHLVGASWENNNHHDLLQLAMDQAQAKSEKRDEERAEGKEPARVRS